MRLKAELAAARRSWEPLTFYQKFEHLALTILSILIALIAALALWHLTLKVVTSIFVSGMDATDHALFHAIFGMIFTVIIALELKRSLLVLPERRKGIVQVQTVILIALLAIVRKMIILDPSTTEAAYLVGLAATVLALGASYWLVGRADAP
jgi:uncharacterized membrane protein (DUF373 family)